MSVIPAKAGIQMVNVTGCRIKSGMTIINARGYFRVNDKCVLLAVINDNQG